MSVEKKRQSHPLFIMQHLVAPVHSGLFSDTVTEKTGILCSCKMDSLCKMSKVETLFIICLQQTDFNMTDICLLSCITVIVLKLA